MLHPIHTFIHRVGRLVFLDRAADPTAAGEIQRNATHVKVYSGGAVRSLSDVHADAHTHASHTGIGTGDHHAQLHAAAHQPAGGDAMAVDAATTTGSLRTLGTGAAQAATGNHTHAGASADISARVFNSANISIPNATSTALTFDSERYDTDTIHSLVTNTGRLTATTAGKYIITANVRWAANATGYRQVDIRLNGSTIIGVQFLPVVDGANNATMNLTTHYNLAATDYVEVFVTQTSGVALNAEAAANYAPEFMMAKVLG